MIKKIKSSIGSFKQDSFCVRAMFIVLFISILGSLQAESAAMLFEIGKKAYQEADYNLCVTKLNQLDQEYPEGPRTDDALYLLSLAYYQLRDFNQSVYFSNALIKRFPESPYLGRMYFWQGMAYLQKKEYLKAENSFRGQMARPSEENYSLKNAYYLGLTLLFQQKYAEAGSFFQKAETLDKDNQLRALILFRKGQIAFYQADYYQALDYFSKSVLDFPKHSLSREGRFFIAECHFQLKQWQLAESKLEFYTQNSSQGPYLDRAFYLLAQSRLEQQKKNAAKEALLRLYQLFPENTITLKGILLLAALYYEEENYNQAVRFYALLEGQGLQAESRESWLLNYGLSLWKNKEAKKAYQILEQAAKANQLELRKKASFYLGKSAAEFDPALAVEILNQFLSSYPQARQQKEALLQLAESYEQLNQLTEAVSCFDRLIASFPEDPLFASFLFKRGNLHLDLKDYSRALNDFFEINKDYPDSEFYAESLYLIGFIYSERKEYVRSRPYFEKCIQQKKSGAIFERASLALSLSFLNEGEFNESVKLTRSIYERLESRQYKADALFYLGYSLFKQEKYQEAAEKLQEAFALATEQQRKQESLYWLAWSMFRTGKTAQAAKVFLNLAEETGDANAKAEALLRAAFCFRKMGQASRALTYLDQTLLYLKGDLLAEALFEKAMAFFTLDMAFKAEKALEQLKINFPQSSLPSEALFQAAENSRKGQNYKQAAQFFLLAYRKFPAKSNSDQALFRAIESHFQAGNEQTAIELGYEFYQKEKNSAYAEELSRIFAEFFQKSRNLSALQSLIEHGYRQNLSHRTLFPLEMARLEMALDADSSLLERAKSMLKEKLAKKQKHKLLFFLGGYYQRQKDYERALNIYEVLSEDMSSSYAAKAYYQKALTLKKQDKNVEAAMAFYSFPMLYPQDRELAAESLFQAYQIYKQSGQTALSEKALDKLRRDYPDSAALKKVLP